MHPAVGDVDTPYIESGMDEGGRTSENKLLIGVFLYM
jgi:hypothetical protein